MITEDYVSYETAKLLKEKGFDEACECFYDTGHNNILSIVNGWMNISNSQLEERDFLCYSAPTLQMAMKWLREKYNIHIEVRYFPMPNIYRYVIIHSPITIENIDSHPQYFKTHEEACETAIKYCLENLIRYEKATIHSRN